MVVGVIRKFESWEDIEDPEKARESYEGGWEFDEPSRRTRSKRRGTSKKEPQEDMNIRRPGGQILPKVPILDEEGNPTGKEYRAVGVVGGSGLSLSDQRRRDRRLTRQSKKKDALDLRNRRNIAEKQMQRQAEGGHPGSVLDEEDMIDMEHGAYQPSKWFGEKPRHYGGGYKTGSGGPGHLKPIDLSEPEQRDKFESGKHTLRDIVTDLKDMYPQYEGHKPDLGWDAIGMEPHFEEWKKRVRRTGTQGEHTMTAETPSMGKPALMEAAERGRIPVEHHYNVDPDTGELMYGVEGQTPGVDVMHIESEARDAPSVGRQKWEDIERVREGKGGKFVEDRYYDKDYETEDEPRTRGTFLNLPWNEETGFTRGSPIDIAFQLLKAPPADWEEMDEAKDSWTDYLEQLYDRVVTGDPQARQEWEKWEKQDYMTTRKIKARHQTTDDDEFVFRPSTPSKPELNRVGVVGTQPETQARAPAKVRVETPEIKEAESQGIWFDEQGRMQLGSRPEE